MYLSSHTSSKFIIVVEFCNVRLFTEAHTCTSIIRTRGSREDLYDGDIHLDDIKSFGQTLLYLLSNDFESGFSKQGFPSKVGPSRAELHEPKLVDKGDPCLPCQARILVVKYRYGLWSRKIRA